MAGILVTTWGSGGDVFPFVPIARALQARGHEVTFAVSPTYRRLVRGEGLRFAGIGRPMSRHDVNPHLLDARPRARAYTGLVEGRMLPSFAEVTGALVDAASSADLVVSHHHHVAATAAARLRGVPRIPVALVPEAVQPPWHARPLLRRLERRFDLAARAAGWPVEPLRISEGPRTSTPTLLLGDAPWFDRPDAWSPTVTSVGFPTWDHPAGWRVPAGLDAATGQGPVVVCTVGTALVRCAGSFYDDARRAVGRFGVRGLLLGDRAGVAAGAPDAFDYVPLSVVLPGAAAIVHAGGIGSTMAALAAGIPQLVVPRTNDQFANARRVRRIGAGRVLPWSRATAGAMAAALGRLLADERAATAARDLAAQLAALGDPAERAADAVEAALRGERTHKTHLGGAA